jgi:hypothetical protein
VITRLRALPLLGQVLVAVAAAVVLGALAQVAQFLGNVVMVLAVLALLAALAVLAQWLWQHQHSTDWSTDFAPPAVVRGSDPRVNLLTGQVQAAVAGDAVAQSNLHEVLRGLAEERLRHRRGIVLGAPEHDEQARAALGPDLTAYLTNPPTTSLTAARVGSYITTLEEL